MPESSSSPHTKRENEYTGRVHKGAECGSQAEHLTTSIRAILLSSQERVMEAKAVPLLLDIDGTLIRVLGAPESEEALLQDRGVELSDTPLRTLLLALTLELELGEDLTPTQEWVLNIVSPGGVSVHWPQHRVVRSSHFSPPSLLSGALVTESGAEPVRRRSANSHIKSS